MRNEKLILDLRNCIDHCNYCADACLDEDNVKKMINCIRIDRVCSEVCASLIQVLAIDYKNMKNLVKLCAQICSECADECEQHDTQHCKNCAEACRKCEESCNNYLLY